MHSPFPSVRKRAGKIPSPTSTHSIVMNPSLHTLEHPSSPLQSVPVLAQNGFNCTLITLDAHAESVLPASHSPDEQLLFVLEGDLAVQTDGLTTLLSRDAATLLVPGKQAVLSSPTGAPVRALRGGNHPFLRWRWGILLASRMPPSRWFEAAPPRAGASRATLAGGHSYS
jgi:hypothetical protein